MKTPNEIAARGTAAVVQRTTHAVLANLGAWTERPHKALRHLTDSVEVFDAACALRDAIQAHLDRME